MTTPQPPEPLGSHCSALHENTLYTFSKTAFLSLSLESGSKWETLPTGVSTEGASCVLAHKGTPDEALYIVGGIVTDAAMGPETGYMGIQRWVFSKAQWEILPTSDPVAYNLSGHGAAFIESSQQIIVFAGTAYPTVNVPSANTFLISTKHFGVSSVPGQAPLLAPTVLQWGRDGALLVGGNPGNTNLNSYTPEAGWKSVGNLDAGLPPKGRSGATLLDGPDGSRMLYTFDFSTAPTTVHQKKVVEGGLRRRQSGGNDIWPAYNSTGAPINRRRDTSFAYDGNGLVVVTGGSILDPVLMFDARRNSWVDTQTVFTSNENDRLSVQETASSSSSSTPTPTSTAASKIPSMTAALTSTAAVSVTPITAVSGSQMPLNTIQILFIVLGAVLATILLLAICFWYLRRRKQQTKKSGSRGGIRGGRTPDPTLSFQDRGLDPHNSFMKEAGGGDSGDNAGFAPLAPPRRMNSRTGPIDSWTAVQFPPKTSDSDRPFPSGLALKEVGASHRLAVTPTSETSPHHSATLHTGLTIKRRNDDNDRSSGWSRYFSGGGGGGSAARRSSDLHPNPYLYSAGAGVIAGGLAAAPAAPSNAYGRGRASTVSSLSSTGADSYTAISANANNRIWDPTRDAGFREPVPSSVYPDTNPSSRAVSAVWMRDERRDTEQSIYSQDTAPTLAPLRFGNNAAAAAGSGLGSELGGTWRTDRTDDERVRGRTESDLSWLNLRHG